MSAPETAIAEVIDLPAAQNADMRIDAIPLFGSRQLLRDGDSNSWLYLTSTTKPERLTRRECMFINAALNAAGRK